MAGVPSTCCEAFSSVPHTIRFTILPAATQGAAASSMNDRAVDVGPFPQAPIAATSMATITAARTFLAESRAMASSKHGLRDL